MAKCILLSRVSSQAQDLDQQTQVIVNEAAKEGFTTKDMIIIADKESAIKLSEEERNGLNRMKQFINDDPTITHVFIYELSRLSRRQLVLFSIRDYLIERGIQLICCTPYFKMLENGKLSQTANLMFSIFASMAESEMQLKQERMMRGRRHNAATGKNSGHKTILGYKTLENKTIVIDEETSHIVKWIFETYSTGLISLERLAQKCQSLYVVDDPKQFTKYRIGFLLRNENYMGSSEYPQLITKELFEKCRETAKQNINTPKHTWDHDAILKRIIVTEDGHHLTYTEREDCKRYINTFNGYPSINKDQINTAVWNLTKMLHENYVNNKDTIKQQLESEKQTYLDEKIVVALKKAKLSKQIDNIEERLIYGKLSKDKAEKMEEAIEQEARAIESQMVQIDEKIRKVDDLLKQNIMADKMDYDKFDIGQKIALIRQMIEKVVISKQDRNHAIAKVYPKVGSFIYIFEMDVYRKITTMRSEMLK